MALVDARCGAIVLLARWKAHRVTNASEMWQRCDELRCSRVAALRVLVAVKLLFLGSCQVYTGRTPGNINLVHGVGLKKKIHSARQF